MEHCLSSILRYIHSPFMGECINIGLIIYFTDTKTFSFKFDKGLSRVKAVYSNVPEKTIREYISCYERILVDNDKELNHKNFDNFIETLLLSKNSNVLQFSEVRVDSTNAINRGIIEEVLFKQYFIG